MTSVTKPITTDDVVFTKATPAQRELSWRINGASWAKPLTIDAHVQREETLAASAQATSTETGGRTYWVMHRKGDPLDIVSAVDSVGKAALVVDGNGLRTGRAYGVGSVYTAPQYRKQGMAGFMLQRLQEAMDADSEFSVLYSDIGTKFYGGFGWAAHPSLQVSVYLEGSGGAAPEKPEDVRFLSRGEMKEYCEKDVAELTERMGELVPEEGRTHVAFLPTFEQLDWQFLRDELHVRAVKGRELENCGAATADGSAWVYWHHDLGKNMLMVHRVVARSPEAVRSLLWAAVAEAAAWGLERVVAWNPEGVVEDGARLLAEEDGVRVRFEFREDSRRPCLRLKGGADGDVVWEDNYFYAWC
ncbi:uncharacterized protein DNG_05942 [Cephalotrichum gorgonifer]|uniref:LYC1 C-terminal domain-containing protein n=1 Tax=Cephalotrichum gorgonifer TaxID=2041049 RepID=A0AAE8MZ28_9PEZI|nr:uncharacterized protein DNG_05942 [Cephalotrichum gorgonifer]